MSTFHPAYRNERGAGGRERRGGLPLPSLRPLCPLRPATPADAGLDACLPSRSRGSRGSRGAVNEYTVRKPRADRKTRGRRVLPRDSISVAINLSTDWPSVGFTASLRPTGRSAMRRHHLSRGAQRREHRRYKIPRDTHGVTRDTR